MTGLDRRRVVLTQSFLYQYGGSEVMTLEVAHALASDGWQVDVVAHGTSSEMAAALTEVAGVRLFRTDDPGLAQVLAESPVDVAWIHQQIIPEPLLRSVGRTRFVFNHMSSFHPLEFAWAYRIEAALAGSVLFPAREALDAQVAGGLLDDIDPARLHVLGNPPPDAFATNPRRPGATLEKLLLVSNHVPAELAAALPALRERYEVTVVGQQVELGAVPRRVTPELVHAHDAVVTIGKTVQYAIAAGVPVYCYDHFGGPGWLSDDNVEVAAQHNFSGRGFERRADPAVVVDEIDRGYAEAREAVRRFAHHAPLLRARLREVLADVQDPPRPQVDDRDVVAHLAVQASLGVFTVMASELEEARRWYVGHTAELEDARAQLLARVSWLEGRVAGLEGGASVHAGRVAELEAALARAEARESELGVAYREARWWAGKHEADAEELRAALGVDEERIGSAMAAAQTLTAELDAARRGVSQLTERLARSEALLQDLERSRLYRFTKHARRRTR